MAGSFPGQATAQPYCKALQSLQQLVPHCSCNPLLPSVSKPAAAFPCRQPVADAFHLAAAVRCAADELNGCALDGIASPDNVAYAPQMDSLLIGEVSKHYPPCLPTCLGGNGQPWSACKAQALAGEAGAGRAGSQTGRCRALLVE